MAKKAATPNPNTTRFSIQGFNMQHFRTTEAYAAMVETLFDSATEQITRAAAKGDYDPDKPFSFADYPALQKEMQKVLQSLTSSLTRTIEIGSKQEWLFACKKNDAFLASILDTSKLPKERLAQLQDRNLDGLKAFQERKTDGMNLSDRVWKIGKQYRENIEDCLDVGLGDGRSAQALARDVKQNLKEPNRLFRRVRDKHGNLRLSKSAKAYHPGQGVYRSSVRNAQRLTRSEINMAYRESDYQRWQSLDFVVGFEIFRSNHEPLCKCDVCAKLTGRYPKNFKFVGWHPQCMCYAVPILEDEETFDENELGDLKAALRGTAYKHKQSANAVTKMPDGFNEWVAGHIDAQKGWKSTPFFIRDNFKNGSLADGLKPDMFVLQSNIEADVAAKVKIRAWSELSQEEQKKYKNLRRFDLYELPEDLKDACDTYGVDYSRYEDMYWDLYDATKPKTDLMGEITDYPDYHKWNEAIDERKRIEQELAGKIANAKIQAQAMIDAYKQRCEDAVVWVKFPDLQHTLDFIDERWNDEIVAKYGDFLQFTKSFTLKQDFTTQIAEMQKNLADAQKRGKEAIAKNPTADVSGLKLLVAETPTKANPAWKIVEAIEQALNGLSSGSIIGTVTPEMQSIMDCTTLSELSKKMIDGGFAKSVSLADMSFERAKAFCTAVVEYVQKFNLEPIDVCIKAFGRGNTNTFAWAHGGKVEYNKRYFAGTGATKKIKESFADNVTNWKADSEANVKKWKGWLDDYDKRIAELETQIKTETNALRVVDLKGELRRWKKARKDLFGSYEKRKAFLDAGHTRHNVFLSEETFVRDMARHELGHTFHDQILGAINGSTFRQSRIDVATANKLQAEWVAIFKKHKDNCPWLSTYGTTNDHEFFSESMVLYMSGGKGLPKDVKAWIDKVVAFARQK